MPLYGLHGAIQMLYYYYYYYYNLISDPHPIELLPFLPLSLFVCLKSNDRETDLGLHLVHG